MTIDIEVQNLTSFESAPSRRPFEQWAGAALGRITDAELLIRLVDRQESSQLNARYRDRDKATNVLSFSADLPEEVGLPLLGDIVICAPLVVEEAQARNTNTEAHWAHLTIHGVFHLLGYDHQSDEAAAEMEALESEILLSLGFPDPWHS
jgi:probable rRNA maturation factor